MNYSLFIYWLKGGMGEGMGVIVVRLVAAATQEPPWGNWALIHGGVTQLAWQNSMQMYSKRMTRKLSFHSSTD